MKINYNVDHKLFAFPIFEEKMTGGQRIALWLAFSKIVHFTQVYKSCTFYQGQMAQDTGIKASYYRWALKLLTKYKYIKCIKPYDRKTLSAAVYQTDTGYVRMRQKLWPMGSKPVSHTDRVNYYVNNSKHIKEDSNESPSMLNEKEQPQLTIEERKRLQSEKEMRMAKERMQKEQAKKEALERNKTK